MIGLRCDELDVIVYHAHCLDGLTAAALFKKVKDGLHFVPMMAGSLPDEVLEMRLRNILFVDCCPKTIEQYNTLNETNRVFILDHHVTSMETLKDIPDDCKHFDMEHCGAFLAMEYTQLHLHPTTIDFIYYIQDYDLMKNDFVPESRYLTSALQMILNPISDSNSKIDMVLNYMNNNFGDLLTRGKSIIEESVAYIDSIIADGYLATDEASRTVYLMHADSINYCTEIGVKTCETMEHVDYSVLVYPGFTSNREPVIKCSFRSKRVDVSEIAKRHGGGGHKFAAGCEFPFQTDFDTLFKRIECVSKKAKIEVTVDGEVGANIEVPSTTQEA